MDNFVKNIIDKLTEFKLQTASYERLLSDIQEVCKHEWECDGHGHNDIYWICTKCGKDRST